MLSVIAHRVLPEGQRGSTSMKQSPRDGDEIGWRSDMDDVLSGQLRLPGKEASCRNPRAPSRLRSRWGGRASARQARHTIGFGRSRERPCSTRECQPDADARRPVHLTMCRRRRVRARSAAVRRRGRELFSTSRMRLAMADDGNAQEARDWDFGPQRRATSGHRTTDEGTVHSCTVPSLFGAGSEREAPLAALTVSIQVRRRRGVRGPQRSTRGAHPPVASSTFRSVTIAVSF